MNIQINDNDLADFNEESKKKFGTQMEDIALEIIKEANRMGDSQDYLSERTQITATSVITACNYVVKGLAYSKRRKMRFLHILCYILSAGLGVIGGLGLLGNTIWIIVFFLIGIADAVVATLLLAKEN
ncbi:MAG: hypothetical protein KAQ68_05210 [Clostridiales bacterium]|nr:hypothetical protein [Clostridiales bacterium]